MRFRSYLSIAALFLVATPALAQQPDAPEPQVHVVRPGDTLWGLARRYLSNPFRWPEIFSLNRDVVSDPHWIYPQERLLLPLRMDAMPRGLASETPPLMPGGRTVFYSSGVEQPGAPLSAVRTAEAAEAPVVTQGSFYGAGVLAPDTAVVPLGELVEIISPTVIPRKSAPQIQPYDRVNMSIRGEGVLPGMRIHLMRRSGSVVPYGRIHVSTGTALVLSVQGDIATVEIDRMYDQVAVGDIALRMPDFAVQDGVRPAPATGLQGILLAFETPQTVAAREDRAYLNLGAASGVVEGDEFVAYLPATVAGWGIRPEVEVARVQVVRAGWLTSAVRVIAMDYPALQAGLPVRLVAKMP